MSFSFIYWPLLYFISLTIINHLLFFYGYKKSKKANFTKDVSLENMASIIFVLCALSSLLQPLIFPLRLGATKTPMQITFYLIFILLHAFSSLYYLKLLNIFLAKIEHLDLEQIKARFKILKLSDVFSFVSSCEEDNDSAFWLKEKNLFKENFYLINEKISLLSESKKELVIKLSNKT